jgi:hypothetical protein
MTKQAGIYRAQLDFEKGYVRAPNEWLRDPRLGLKAKGLLIYFLSHEVGYVITLAQIERETADGRAAIRSAISELISAGYLETDMTKDTRGYNAGLAYTLKNPKCENPTLDNPTLENRTAYRKQPLREEKELKNNIGDSTNAPTEQEFAEFYRLYPRKVKPLEAKKAFLKARNLVSYEILLESVRRFASDPNLPQKQFIPHPSTWLNAGEWESEPLPERVQTIQEQKLWRDKKLDAQSEASRESARRAIAEAAEAKAYAKANPAPRCEHNRVAVICDTCNKKTARIKTQQSGGTN